MRYLIKGKVLSWGDDFCIRDADDRECFFVDGKVFSLGNKLSFQDMEGQELAFISQRLLSWGPSYEIERNGAKHAVVKKNLFTLFRSKFNVEIGGPGNFTVDGDFFGHEYQFRRGRDRIAQVSKKWFSWTDSYGVDVQDGEDEVLILSCAIVIAQICRDARRSG